MQGDRRIPVNSDCGHTYIYISECACGKFNSAFSAEGGDFIHGNCIMRQVYNESGNEKGDATNNDGRINVYHATYRCAIETCNVEYTFERYTIADHAHCKETTYYVYTVDGVEYKFTAVNNEAHTCGEEVKVEDVQILDYTVPHMRETCSVCGEVINDYLYLTDKYGRTVVYYNYLESYGYAYVIYSDCTYTSYTIDENLNCTSNDDKYTDGYNPKAYMHANSWWNYNHIEGSCTQVGRDEKYCEACHTVETWTSGYPEGHSFVYDYDNEFYVCTRCGVQSTKGNDANFIMEDFSSVKHYDNVYNMLSYGYFAVGFFNKYCQRSVDVYVILNYNDADDSGEWLSVDYERHYVNEGYNDKYGCFNTAYGKVVLDNESLLTAVANSGVTEITSISVSFTYYDAASDTYLSEILTIYTAE